MLTRAEQDELIDTQPKRSSAEPIPYADMVARIKSGDETGAEDLYRLFARGLRYYLSKELGAQLFEDALNDVFVAVIRSIRRGNLSQPERLSGFIRTIAHRQVARYVQRLIAERNQHESIEYEKTGAPISSIRCASPNPEQALLNKEKEELVRGVLADMRHRDREIIVRFYLEGQSKECICASMGLTETQFRINKSRAKAKFSHIGTFRWLSTLPGNLADFQT